MDVTEFADDREGTGPSARELTAGFTRKLTESRIYSPAALPGAAGSYDFLQVVENAGEVATASWWKIAARALRLLRPPAAYRAPLIIEDTTWDRVLERAAHSVAGRKDRFYQALPSWCRLPRRCRRVGRKPCSPGS